MIVFSLGLMVHQTFLYISLSSPHKYDVKMPNFTLYEFGQGS